MSLKENLDSVLSSLPKTVKLIAVSKTKPVSDILAVYDAGQLDFGENRVQEMVEKYEQLPKDIKWHMIGHLQKNKVKYIAGFVELIHSVDSEDLLKEIDKQAANNNRIINCLLQIRIAEEETKFGLEIEKADKFMKNSINFPNVKICGLMGMATFTDDTQQIRNEFSMLKTLYDKLLVEYPDFKFLSLGMSGDYQTAIEEGSNMVRIGSLIFGSRN